GGRHRAGPLPGDRHPAALSHRSHRQGDQDPRQLLRPQSTVVGVMSFDLDPTYAIYAFAVVSAILFGEGVYLLFFSAASYRNRINRRLSLLSETVDRQSILVELRRERGLTMGGDFRLPVVSLNRLIVQSGISMGL